MSFSSPNQHQAHSDQGKTPQGGPVPDETAAALLKVDCTALSGDARLQYAMEVLRTIREHPLDGRPQVKMRELCGDAASHRPTLFDAATHAHAVSTSQPSGERESEAFSRVMRLISAADSGRE